MQSFEIGVVGCLTKILNSVNYGDCFKLLIGTEYFDIDAPFWDYMLYIYTQSLAINLAVA